MPQAVRRAVASTGNIYSGTTGTTADLAPGSVFTPPSAYASALTPASSVEADVKGGAGPR